MNGQVLVYPVIVYHTSEGKFDLVLNDLGLVTSGDTMEEAFVDLRSYLESYYKFAVQMEDEVSKPTPYSVVAKAKVKNLVIVLDLKTSKNR